MKKNDSSLDNNKDYFNDLRYNANHMKNREVNRIDLCSSNHINNFIKSLSRPQFLGSIHLNKETTSNFSSVENLLKGELELKLNNSLKNIFFNPITKILILLTIAFNIFWLIFI